MKASKMTNEELASFFDELASFNREDDKFRETAERLRNQCITIPAQRAKGAGEGYAHGCEEVADLRRRLKAAEDSLEKITTGCFSHKDGDKPIVQVIIDIASNALFAIREEGGAE